jgi:6-pyruvoyltetrahydropterin/6-carboxytetrahydropterin synthase
MYELRVKTRFAAAHRLTLVGHKCENLHGHNWNVEVCLRGENLDEGGVLLDFGIIKKKLSAVIDELDHTFLNENPAFEGRAPSSEHIARHIALALGKAVNTDSVRVFSVTAWESEDSCATFFA